MGRRVAVKNQTRALLRSLGVEARAGKALWSNKGLAWLKAVPLEGADALRRDLLAEELEDLTAKVKRVEKELKVRADAHPGVTLLMKIPGVGVRTASRPPSCSTASSSSRG